MRKETAKDIATVLVAASGIEFDAFAFEDTDLSEIEKYKILKEINILCHTMINKIEKKYSSQFNTQTTKEIINSIIYE